MLVTFPFTITLGILLVIFSKYAGHTTEPNSAIGIRTKATLSSKESWVAGHRAAKPWILTAGISAILVSVASQAMALVGFHEELGEYLAVSGIVCSTVILLIGTNVANREAVKI